MNRKQIINTLKDHSLDEHTRESLRQLLHYMQAEGVTDASTQGILNGPRTTSARTAQTYPNSAQSTRNKRNKHTSSRRTNNSS